MFEQLEFDFDDAGFRALLEKIPRVAAGVLKYTATDLWSNIRREAPTDHGRLAGSFALSKVGDMAWRIQSGVAYAMAVYSGTGTRGDTSLGASGRPYDILPRAKKALYWKGADHPVKAVYGHPGIKSNPYIDRAEESTKNRLSEFVVKTLREAGVS